ncbi:MAG TPA: glucosamine-6-phosphate deaminase [Flavisolibacter sp.]|nr:glucosamine-6-phosphate deaminase [Flavisolibacter sp.]
MNITICENYDELSKTSAAIIMQTVLQKPDAFICLASGDSPTGTYQYLVKWHNEKKLSFRNCYIIALDEWLGIDAAKAGGTMHYLMTNFLEHVDADKEKIYFFNSLTSDAQSECKRIETVLKERGAIDIALVGIGLNGHIGLNEPGSDFSAQVHISTLASSTINSAQRYFSGKVHLVKGITLGIKNIMEAKRLILIASGEKKADIVSKAVQGEVNNTVPATIIQHHVNSEVILDKAAAMFLPQLA